jgi:hypothetical protein
MRKIKTVNFSRIHKFLLGLFDNEVHAKRVLSITNAVLGVITTASLAVHLIGQGLATAKGTVTKHGIKQVDRLLSNIKFDMWGYFFYWVPQVVGSRKEVIIAMDWTEFDFDGQSTIALYLVSNHGRATPLIWRTHSKANLKNNMNRYEKEMLVYLKEILGENIHVTILADRGFGNLEFYEVLEKLEFDYVVRFKSNVYVTNRNGDTKTAKEWVGLNGKAKRLDNAEVTKGIGKNVAVVICVQDKDMKDSWCLAASNSEFTTREIINMYAKRWTIEAKFRDQKNLRFGMGLYNVIISDEERRDRLFFLGAIADLLLTILGAAGEALGFDRLLKANTLKRRVHSLYRQGVMWYELIPNMPEERLRLLMDKFNELLMEKKATRDILSFT